MVQPRSVNTLSTWKKQPDSGLFFSDMQAPSLDGAFFIRYNWPMDILKTLQGCALFADLDEKAIKSLAKCAQWVELKSGSVLYHRGEEGDGLYVIANGRLGIYRQDDPQDEEQLLAELGRYAVVGEISVITGEPRSVTVRGVRDSGLIRISSTDFQKMMSAQPEAMRRVTRHIVDRLRSPRDTRKRDAVASTRTIAVVPAHSGVDIKNFTTELCDELLKFGSTLRIDAKRVDDALGAGFSTTVFEDSGPNQQLYSWLNALEGQYRHLVYQANEDTGPWSRRCLRQADRVLLLVDATLPAEDTAMLRCIRDNRIRAPIEVVLLHAEEDSEKASPLDWRALCRSRFHHHVGNYPTATIRRLARMVTGRGLGLVLSGGGARGLAHLGVLRALEERNLPVDLVGGTSMGAFIAALVAVGYRFEHLMEVMGEMFRDNSYLNDYSLSRISLIRGSKMMHRIEEVLGDVQIQDLPIPYYCITTNLSEGHQSIHDRGRLSDWVAASMSVPGIAPPFVYEGDLLVDGGLMNNLPADVMANIGRGPIVASDVTPSREMRLEVDQEQERPYMLYRRKGDEQNFNMFKILFQSATMTGEDAVATNRRHADLLLKIPVDDIGMFGWESFDEVVFRGYHYASERLDQALGDGRLRQCVEEVGASEEQIAQ